MELRHSCSAMVQWSVDTSPLPRSLPMSNVYPLIGLTEDAFPLHPAGPSTFAHNDSPEGAVLEMFCCAAHER